MYRKPPLVFRGRAVVSTPEFVDVKALRRRMGMTQNTFSARFGFSLAALRHWERHERLPSGAALTLLNVISKHPRAVLLSLRGPPIHYERPLGDEDDADH